MEIAMNKWEEYVRRVIPYVPGEQPKEKNIIKLNTNECPYPPAPGVLEELKKINYEDFRLYPDPNSGELIKALAKNYEVKEDEIFVGVGSDDVLAMAFLTFFGSKKPILFPDITYSFYDVWADLFGIPYETCPLNEKLEIVPSDYKRENGGIIFPNPNAPTGLFMELSGVEEVLQANPDVIVIVDEAYIDFGGNSAKSLLKKYENLLVVQTFSKSRAMAGMRIGFAMGNSKLIKYLNDVKFSFNSYTMNLPSQRLGVKAVEDRAYFEETIQKIVTTREWVKKELKALGFVFPDSRANFIFASHPDVSAEEIFLALKKEGILVRFFRKPKLEQYLRITIGTDEEMKSLLFSLKSCLMNR